MRRRGRVIAALALALVSAPGNILRTPVPDTFPLADDITVRQIAGASETGTTGWRVAGVWEYSADSLNFGGFSAIMPLGPERLRAFSDRGFRFSFTDPDRADIAEPYFDVSHQPVSPGYAFELWDIEAVTRDPATNRYWLSFESFHAIQRYSISSQPEALRVLDDEVDWPVNGGAEAMVRLADGRFLIIAEDSEEALVYPSDPTEGAVPVTIRFDAPAPGYVATDVTQLPDGRVLLLMRDLAWRFPPFSSFIAIADPPASKPGEQWRPDIALNLDTVIPFENYEGMTARARDDGLVEIWLVADDNRSIIQRSLVVKLLFDPGAAAR